LEEKDTPIIRKIIDVGKTSRGVILPKSWLEFFERETGKEVNHVAMEVDKTITIFPYVNSEKTKKETTP